MRSSMRTDQCMMKLDEIRRIDQSPQIQSVDKLTRGNMANSEEQELSPNAEMPSEC